MLAIWFGLLTGLAEVVILAVRKLILHQIVDQGDQVVWMAPLADLILMLVPAAVLALFAFRWPRAAAEHTSAGVFTFVGAFGLLLMYPRLYRAAAVILAVGVAVQVARRVAARPGRLTLLVRYSLAWMVGMVVAVGFGINAWRRVTERSELAALPEAEAGAPNVLLLILDTVRAASLSAYGYERPSSPALKQLAARGVRFDWAIAPSSWTLPSHASMFTGRWPHEVGADWSSPLDATHLTLAGELSSRGYATAGFVANLIYCGREHGLDRGFIHYEDYRVTPGEVMLSSALGQTIVNSPIVRRISGHYDVLGRKSAAMINRSLLDWLSSRSGGRLRPWLAFINYNDAHEPYLPPAGYDGRFGSVAVRRNQLVRTWRREGARLEKELMTPAEVAAERDAYDASVAYLDRQIGLLLDSLDARGDLRNTLVIVAGDHGEQFGEHGLFTHGNSLYVQTLRVPLIVAFAGHVPEGATIAQPVSLRDLPATVMELVSPGSRPRFPGASLARTWRSPESGRSASQGAPGSTGEALISELSKVPRLPRDSLLGRGDMKSMVMDWLHYIRLGDGSEEVYDWARDSLETRNVVSEPRSQPLRAEARRIFGSTEGVRRPPPGH